MSENLKLFMLGVIIIYDTYLLIKNEWDLEHKNKK